MYVYICVCTEQFRIDVIIVFKNRSIESNGSTHRDSHILFSFFFSFLHLSNEIIRLSQRATSYQDRVFRTICSLWKLLRKFVTTTNDRLTFRRLHPQLFHAFPDLFEVRVRDPHAIGHEFVARRIGQRAVTPGHHGSAAFLASGHLNCSQDNTHG